MKTVIYIETIIDAPPDRCFDLSRSIDLHVYSTQKSNERAVAGRRAGLIELDETVTWEATHFFMRQLLTTKITAFERPAYFQDCQQQGAFKTMVHDHIFRWESGKTLMIDKFVYEVPLGIIGKLFDVMILKRYMTTLLRERNETIRRVAESEDWKRFVPLPMRSI